MYTTLGKMLQHYKAGKLPKALKMLPHLKHWEVRIKLPKKCDSDDSNRSGYNVAHRTLRVVTVRYICMHENIRLKPKRSHGASKLTRPPSLITSSSLPPIRCLSIARSALLLIQRFFNVVLLEKCRDDIRTNKKLNYHYYMALKKALFKVTPESVTYHPLHH